MKKMSRYREFSTELQLRSSDDENNPYFEGYFIKYNSPAPAYGDWMEQIDSNALKQLESRDIRCLYNHNHDIVLGRQSAGTLEIENREDGLFGRCKLNLDDSDARNIYARVKRGDITGCSFGALINKQSVDKENGLITLSDLDLVEVSVCPFPFYEDTTMDARAREIEVYGNTKANSLKCEFIKRRLKRKWL